MGTTIIGGRKFRTLKPKWRLQQECTHHQSVIIVTRNHDGFDRVQCLQCGSTELRRTA
jgi:hypothetical protein